MSSDISSLFSTAAAPSAEDVLATLAYWGWPQDGQLADKVRAEKIVLNDGLRIDVLQVRTSGAEAKLNATIRHVVNIGHADGKNSGVTKCC